MNIEEMIGKRVIKHSKKPFKSRLQVNTVKGILPQHPDTGRPCFLFEEDDSYVECKQVKLYGENK